MGVVWAAIDTTSGAPCAVKLLTSTDDDGKRRDLSQRLRREARAASAVEHPNLVRILDVLELEDGSPALVMEYLEGESLAARLGRERVLSLGDFAKIFVQILAGVEAVHAHKIIHRDLKPENVFLVDGTPPRVKVLDFGIAKLTATEGELVATTNQTATSAVVGTPLYMSPEQFGERDIDARTDVWSLGLIAYRCLSGVLPWQADNPFEVYRMISTTPVTPLEELAQGMPEDVARLVRRMLSRKREDRPGDLREVVEVFAPYADGRASASVSSSGRIVPPGENVADEYATTYIAARDQTSHRPVVTSTEKSVEPRPKRRGAVGLAVLAGVGIASIGVLRMASHRSPNEAAAAPPAAMVVVTSAVAALPSTTAVPAATSPVTNASASASPTSKPGSSATTSGTSKSPSPPGPPKMLPDW
jgi:serine/threonine-protein kinase